MDVMDQYPEEEFLKMDGFDDEIIGVTEDMRLIYSVSLIIARLISEGSTEEDALDHFGYNIVRSLPYMGAKAPILCYDDFLERRIKL